MGKTSHITWERLDKFANNFRNHYKNVGDIEKSKDPQEWSGALKSLPISDTDERLTQSNIQGVGIHLVKINKPMGRLQTRQMAGVNYMGGESASPTNPE